MFAAPSAIPPRPPHFIETRSRRGYCFVAAVSSDEAPAKPSERAAPFPETLYASSGDVNLAYQIFGEGQVDLVFVMG